MCVSTRARIGFGSAAPVRRCIQAVDAEKKVMIGFRLGDLWTDTFTYQRASVPASSGVSLKARLLFVSWIKVDGKLVYKAEPSRPETDERDPEVPVTSDARLSKPRHRSLPEPVADAADDAADAPCIGCCRVV